MLKRYLFAPGPTPVPSEVLLEMAMPIIHHRSPDFMPVLESAKKDLQWLYQTKNDVIILCSTGTGGMVGAVNNFFNNGDRVLVINGGKFGERWTEICQAYGLQVEEIIVEWGYAVKPDIVEKRLKKGKDIKGVFVQASETSTGVYHDIKALASIIKKYEDTLFIVDAISALVAHDLRTDEWGIDIMVAGSQKGVMLPPGLAFVSVSEKAWAKAEKSKLPKFYFNFKKERENLAKNQTNFTSPVTLIIGLNASLKMLKAEGLKNVFKRHERLANVTRRAVQALGLELYSKESPSNSVTAILAPPGIDGQAVYKNLREKYGIIAGGGQGKAKGKIFRIAHLGYSDRFDVIIAIAGIEMVLKGMGHPVKLGTGVAVAQELLID
ncbi:MAG: aminotransferase [Nitrospirae bacterium CG_4_10_14_0_8_um_filter_41_23]|nr:alanine--glyoxylate aminotransferase family protein [Nitrospirota bacterium]OIP59473.1 MAG: class V aminotransferase [Nitrospirae bacterium CG2_30_41_42]PIQ93538.1 MAG: aminotransferase [Nitrospirae bacterium CG11_big_fil_rev_8_21_14_0_20_41_14]PIV44726.1 MAG: aminotransferase [Nitrospirae bacterium CG02_land_8_20_14_3_00_41_53]PIY87591.1 MAG: aminotransferase [Nitrospirae bacterium CG_4_10_14_0_8_um_filter_41_23]PJA79663.1 MAG: aminotransferase [Nitrospirae bacterium CG_4_9_14_3_um_filter_